MERIIEPLAAACVADHLDAGDRTDVVRFLAAASDPRAQACFVHVLDSRRRDDETPDAQLALVALTAMKLRGASPAVLRLLERFDAGRPGGWALGDALVRAVVALCDVGDEPRLIGMLTPRIEVDAEGEPIQAEVFRQRTAVRALGALRSERAMRALFEVAAAPDKASITETAAGALVEIGKPR